MLFVDFLFEAVHFGTLGIRMLPEFSGDGEGVHFDRTLCVRQEEKMESVEVFGGERGE